jgi:hypothetical protein
MYTGGADIISAAIRLLSVFTAAPAPAWPWRQLATEPGQLRFQGIYQDCDAHARPVPRIGCGFLAKEVHNILYLGEAILEIVERAGQLIRLASAHCGCWSHHGGTDKMRITLTATARTARPTSSTARCGPGTRTAAASTNVPAQALSWGDDNRFRRLVRMFIGFMT